MRKFARRWFGPYVVTSANDNGTYHLAELDGTRMATPVVGKRVKAFKKRNEGKPDLEGMYGDDADPGRMTNRKTRNKHGPVFSSKSPFWRIPVDARLGGGGCREENRP